jgi:hypothetical protein
MYLNTKLYVFINGISTLVNQQSAANALSNLISLNSISIGVDIGIYQGTPTNYSSNKYNGIISQPLITKTAKYNINGFLPDWILTPKEFNNVIFWIDNSIDIITSKTVPLTGNIFINSLESSPIIPIITLNSTNLNYILLNSTYADTGVIVSYMLQPNIIPYIISIKDELFNAQDAFFPELQLYSPQLPSPKKNPIILASFSEIDKFVVSNVGKCLCSNSIPIQTSFGEISIPSFLTKE